MYDFSSMESELEYCELFLDSNDSSTTSGSYSKTDWPTFYLDRPLYNIISMKVLQAEIPFSYYVINSENNTFILQELGVPIESVVVTIPVGNYNSSTLQAVLQTALNDASYYNKVYTVTFDQATQKLSIFCALGQFALFFNEEFSTPREVLGMDIGVNTAEPEGPFGVNSILVSRTSVQITGPNYIYLCSEMIGTNFQTWVPQRYVLGGGKGPQIAKIPINVNPADVAYYTDPAHEKWFEVGNLPQLSTLDLFVTLGNSPYKTRFNGLGFSIKLGVYTLKK